MSIENIIILILLVVLPLLQAAGRWLSKQRAMGLERSMAQDTTADSNELEQTEPSDDWRAAEPPVFPLPAIVPPRPPAAPPPPPPPPPPTARAARLVPARPVRRHYVLPRDREGLRRAQALAVILGPPRALKPSDHEP
ncbi:MAG TPA: hypothetical protein VI072_11415 [Polyangiaceae bacterium]